MKRASEVPPVVDRTGCTPSSPSIASAHRATNGSGGVRKASPEMAASTDTVPRNPALARRASASSQRTSSAPLWAGLKRMLIRARARAGMMFWAGLPISISVISRLEGWNSG